MRASARGSGGTDLNAAGRAFDWVFRDRKTGAITIGQWPNAPLLVFGLCAAVDWLAAPTGLSGTVLRVVGTVALAVWALDEIVRGVNPWRRALGAVVLIALAWRLAFALT